MAAERNDKYWTRIKVSIALPFVLFILYIIEYIIQIPSNVEDPEFTFSTYPVITATLWLMLLSFPFVAVLFWHSIYKDKQELSKDYPDVKQRRLETIGVFIILTAGIYPIFYAYSRLELITRGEGSSGNDKTQNGSDSHQNVISDKQKTKETSHIQSQKLETEQSKNPNQESYNKKNSTNIGKSPKKKQKTRQKIDDIRSDLEKVDSLVTDAEYKQAKQSVEDVRQRISSLKREKHQNISPEIDSEIKNLDASCNKKLSKSHILRQLRDMNPYEFEKLVAKIWKKQGWDTELTTGSRDRGVDVVAIKKGTFEKRRHLIQVKRHGENSKVGSGDIQKYAGLYQGDDQVDNVFVVTSNRFTSEAKEVAKSRDVSLVNCDELYERITET